MPKTSATVTSRNFSISVYFSSWVYRIFFLKFSTEFNFQLNFHRAALPRPRGEATDKAEDAAHAGGDERERGNGQTWIRTGLNRDAESRGFSRKQHVANCIRLFFFPNLSAVLGFKGQENRVVNRHIGREEEKRTLECSPESESEVVRFSKIKKT